jgi:hypothetical protein
MSNYASFLALFIFFLILISGNLLYSTQMLFFLNMFIDGVTHFIKSSVIAIKHFESINVLRI